MAHNSEMQQSHACTAILVGPSDASTLAQPLLRDHPDGCSSLEQIANGENICHKRGNGHNSDLQYPDLSRASSLQRLGSQGFAWKFKYEHLWDSQPDPEDATFAEGKREFYRRQRATLEGFRQVDELLTRGPAAVDEHRRQLAAAASAEMRAVQLSNAANVVLLVGKIFASIESGSLAVIASTLDSLLDLVAGALLWATARSVRQKGDKYRYPAGNRRMQPVGIIVFAAIMATLGVQVLLEGVRQLLAHHGSAARLGWTELAWVCGVFSFVLISKLGLFLLCRTYENEIVQAYAQDHFLDVLTNAVSLGAVLLARQLAWWADPAGAIGISLYTIGNWSTTVFQNAASLVGVAAPPEFISKVTYMVLNHDKRIQRIDTVRAWTFGTLYMVEVDIELPEEMGLREAHDIGEDLQNKLEAMPEVDRAFVHLDYESHHRPEHSGQ